MEIKVTKYTDVELLRLACSYTTGKDSKATLGRSYRCEHSPMRTQMFLIEMKEIPTFVSVHFVRHKFGVEHFVRSNREDRGGNINADRMTPVDHAMWVNAQELVFMARKRLCRKAHITTQEVMQQIVEQVRLIDPDLADKMVPECIYRGFCPELKTCGYSQTEESKVLLEKYWNS